MREYSEEEWEKARSMAVNGIPFKDIRESLGISCNALRKRSEAEQWATPQRMQRAVHKEIRAQHKLTLDEVRDEVAQRYAEERGLHRDKILDTVKTVLSNMNVDDISVKSVKDLKMLDEVQRRNLGMDLEDESNVKRINPALYPQQS